MPNWCENHLTVVAPTKKRLQEFIKAAKETDTDLSIQNLFPMPVELDIENGSDGQNGLAILEYQDGNPNELHKILEYHWVKARGVTTFDALIKLLKDENRVDIDLAKQMRKNVEKFGYPTWYEWRVANWGIKWDVSAVLEMFDEDGTKAVYHFESPWSPPIAAFAVICAKWPDLEFTLEYAEPNMAFAGKAKFFQGALTSDECHNMTIDEMRYFGLILPDDENYENNDEEDENA